MAVAEVSSSGGRSPGREALFGGFMEFYAGAIMGGARPAALLPSALADADPKRKPAVYGVAPIAACDRRLLLRRRCIAATLKPDRLLHGDQTACIKKDVPR